MEALAIQRLALRARCWNQSTVGRAGGIATTQQMGRTRQL